MQSTTLYLFAALSSLATACQVNTTPANRPNQPVAAAQPGPAGPRSERRDDARDRRVEAQTNWDKLGERMVDGKSDRDGIAVGRAEGKFSVIQLKVEQSSLEMFDVVVSFADGTSFSPNTRVTFGQGSTSRVIDLPGEKRVIKRVDFKYGNIPGGGRAQVELWAK
jgi:hypothetical protein